MSEYVPISERVIERWSAKWLRKWLLKAQAEIERLNEEASALKHPERRVEPDRRIWNRRFNATSYSEGHGRRTDTDRRKS